ncbi:S9 family peptidase [Winogradskyella aurantiaca]|uniref:S9 family peptidase n=1 Tax=Winogradskyella aurantiaca TaxID=2219558 RepID=UPI000E1E12C2|nr:S9 family peptidase [Winogradskyella aurantiaca]
MKSVNYFITLCYLFGSILLSAQDKTEPNFEDILSLESVSNAQMSPNGQYVVYLVQSTDWENNRYDRELWISNGSEPPFQLTNTAKGSSGSPQWSPDSKWIGFTADRNDKNQLYVIRPNGGEAIQVTHSKQGISAFRWSPDGNTIAFIETKENKRAKEQEELYGGFAEDDKDYRTNQLWTMNFNAAVLSKNMTPEQLKDSSYQASIKPKLHLEESDLYINSVLWSPDGSKIAIEHQPNSIITSFFNADISIYNLEDETLTTLVDNPSYDGLVDWSPDGSSILFESNVDDTDSNFYLNSRYFIISTNTKESKEVATNFDENINNLRWHGKGIFGLAFKKTKRSMVELNPDNGEVTFISMPNERIYNVSFGKDQIAYTAANDDSLTEVFRSNFQFDNSIQITRTSSQIKNWLVAQSDVVSWKSKDGAIIEGILHKPQNYDPNKKYPLMVVIHGGPTGISTPGPTPSYVYPIVQWLNKGALVLRPNYRGSAGYGEKFRSLNVKNLGVGDAWDVISGVEHLTKEGLIDKNKVASMGWSQGGYISAFLTTNSNVFQAISVGAGISNWMTYYVNTDIHPFTRQYLKSTPWSDEEMYRRTSPMTNITKASTPTLIQHGEFDRRVPVANAYELYQGLQDNKVPSKLIIYKGFGHGITKPKERLAATWHNWQWINKYIWNEEIQLPMD